MTDESRSWKKQATRILVEAAAAEYFDRHRSFLRLVLAGNAGGLFAILTIIGVFMGADRDAHLPPSFFYIELIYVLGLCGALLATLMDVWMADIAIKIKSKVPETGLTETGDAEHFQALRQIWSIAARVALVCLIVGTLLALVLLHIQAGSPPLPFGGSGGRGGGP